MPNNLGSLWAQSVSEGLSKGLEKTAQILDEEKNERLLLLAIQQTKDAQIIALKAKNDELQKQQKARNLQFNNFIKIFKNLGCNADQSKVYAEISMNNPNDFSTIMKHIKNQQTIYNQKCCLFSILLICFIFFLYKKFNCLIKNIKRVIYEIFNI